MMIGIGKRGNSSTAMQRPAKFSGIAFRVTRKALLPALTIGLSLLADAPVQAQAGLYQHYSAQVYGQRVGVSGEPFASEASGPTGVARSAGGTDWLVTASSDDAFGGTVAASASLRWPLPGQETYTTQLTGASALHYVFTIDGPDPDALIPVNLTGAGGISITAGGAAVAQLGFGHDGVASYWRVDFEYGKVGSQGFDVNELFYLQTGHVYSLELVAQASVDMRYIAAEGGSAFANASVDPTFTIQDGFAQRYHFVGLPESAIGSPSGSAVPEPASWAMMVGGFGLIGSAMRGRRGVGAGVSVQ
jgi:hypothetical protein